MEIKLALAGNPNCGKTTLFNELTGSSQYVGNWPGVTVEKKEGKLKAHKDVIIQDLPGIYSLSPYTLEEVVARNYLLGESPDGIINIVDGSNLERNLYLTTQLLELGIPMVLAINMIDVVRKRGDQIDLKALSEKLGCPCVELSALTGEGALAVAEKAVDVALKKATRPKLDVFSASFENVLRKIEQELTGKIPEHLLRWYACKLFERDKDISTNIDLDGNTLARIESIIKTYEDEVDDDAESIMAGERYNFIGGVVSGGTVRRALAPHDLTISDKIDRIVTNRFLALPIFALIMFIVYYISVSTIGTYVTDWTNDTLFGEMICGNLSEWMEANEVAPWLSGLTVDGIVGGVGAVLGFVPQMFVLFLMLSLLEDVGYMARVAFIMDRIFRKMGLSGKSFIPMLIASGCGVPGVMASRTIENDRDRKMTIMTTCFIPCGAKMPIIALFAGALFDGSGLIATSAYFFGVLAVIVSGIILKKTKIFAGDPAPFVMELPSYHMPRAINIWRATWERGWSFIQRAGSVILISAIVLWFLQAFGYVDGSLEMVEDSDASLIAGVGNAIAPIFSPLGFGDWKATVAAFTGLIAKENVVSTLGVLYGFAEVAEDGEEIWANLASEYTPLSAYSFLLFNLFCAPCFAAIGAIKREMNSPKWTFIAIGYMTGFAYCTSFMVYQLGLLYQGNPFTILTGLACVILAITLYLLFRPNPYLKEDNSSLKSLRSVAEK